MKQKIFDIIPPKGKNKLAENKPFSVLTEKSIQKKENGLSGLSEKKAGSFSEKRIIFSPKKKFIFLIIVFILVFFGGFLSYFQLQKAEIKINPETQPLGLQKTIIVDLNVKNADLSLQTIPGKLISNEFPLSQEFPSSGKSQKKAEGVIRVYNAHSSAAQVFLTGTRFVSAGGKLFKTLSKVIIPGGRDVKGKLEPGFIDIKAIADQPGKDYNIGPSTFSIPGFAGTPKYTTFYAKSFSPMAGGGEQPAVTEEDLQSAEKNLTEKALQESKDALKNQISSDMVFLDETLSREITEASSDAKAGQELSVFNFRVNVKSQNLLFKRSDLENLIKDSIISQVPADKKLLPESTKINFKRESIDFQSGKLVLNVKIEAKIYSEIETDSLKKAILGKSLAEAQILLKNQLQIKDFKINLWPFWVKKVPENIKRIKININLLGG